MNAAEVISSVDKTRLPQIDRDKTGHKNKTGLTQERAKRSIAKIAFLILPSLELGR